MLQVIVMKLSSVVDTEKESGIGLHGLTRVNSGKFKTNIWGFNIPHEKF